MAFGRNGVHHFIHIGGIDIGLDDNHVINKQSRFSRPHGVGYPACEIDEGNFCRDYAHMPNAEWRAEYTFHGQTQLFEFRVNLGAFDQSGCSLSFVNRHSHVGKWQDGIIAVCNRLNF